MKVTLLLLATVGLLTGCEKARQAQETYHNVSAMQDAGEKMEQNMQAAQDRHAARVKAGDTLALPYKELENYLPASVSGYTAEAPTGESVKMTSMAFSSAERTYRQGDHTVTVKLIDYNGANTLFQGASAVFGMGLETENDESLTRTAPLKVEGTRAMETLNKKDGDAELSLVAGDRFLVSVKADHQQDLTLVEQVARQLDLEKLAKL